jgi:hypothetical protein
LTLWHQFQEYYARVHGSIEHVASVKKGLRSGIKVTRLLRELSDDDMDNDDDSTPALVLPWSGSVRFRGDFARTKNRTWVRFYQSQRTQNRTLVNSSERSGLVFWGFEREPNLKKFLAGKNTALRGSLHCICLNYVVRGDG